MREALAEHAKVRAAKTEDLSMIAEINAAAFAGNRGDVQVALEWVQCWFCAFPLYQYFIMEVDGKVVGYIGWQIHGGFLRENPVLELEQIAMAREFQGQKLGPKLIQESLEIVVSRIQQCNTRMKNQVIVVVWAYETNTHAFKVYEKDFPDGVMGIRTQYGGNRELMLRKTIVKQ